MIRLVVFDMDGTLVQTEQLKAESYAKAAVELDPALDAAKVEAAYGPLVGRSREDIARTLMARFGLERASRARMAEFGADEPWEAYVGVRLRYYRAMLDDTDRLRAHAWPDALALLREARTHVEAVALATTSRRDLTGKVLAALGVAGAFDLVATADDVPATKPDPAVYRFVTGRLGVPPAEALAIEDSPSGVRAALAAGLACLAVPTGLTRDGVRRLVEAGVLDPAHVVDDPARLALTVRKVLEAARSGSSLYA